MGDNNDPHVLLVPPISAENCPACGKVLVEQMETAAPGGMQGTKAGPQNKALFLKATRECPQGSAHRSAPYQQPLPHRQCDGLETHRLLLESGEISSPPLIHTASPPQFAEHSYVALHRRHIHHRVTGHLFLKYLFIGLCQALVGACRISSCGR